jgi:hypothetical protein
MNYWKRYICFTIGKRDYQLPYTLTFQSDFSMKGRSNTRAYIFNPSEETIENVAPRKGENQKITIDAGFTNDHGICIIGEIYHYNVSKQGFKRYLELFISDSITQFSGIKISKTWDKGVKASSVINDIVGISGIDPGKIEIKNDKTYERGITFNTHIQRALYQMKKETESDFFLRNGKLYFLPKNDPGIKTGIELSSTTGLLDKPEILAMNKNGKYVFQGSVKSLFNYRVGPGEHINIISEDYNGKCKVIKGNHYFSENEAYTEMEVVQL